MMRAVLRGLLTDAQGRIDEMALLTILGLLSFIGLEIFAVVVRHQHFDAEGYGMGLGSAIGAATLGMGLKSKFGD
ncbi:MAG: hypothetical protein ACP5M1_00380 [Acidiphilium sp.]|jgi:hypothetical protein